MSKLSIPYVSSPILSIECFLFVCLLVGCLFGAFVCLLVGRGALTRGTFWEYICDMIKRNESDVGNVVLEIIGKNNVQIPFVKILHNSVTRYPIVVGFGSK